MATLSDAYSSGEVDEYAQATEDSRRSKLSKVQEKGGSGNMKKFVLEVTLRNAKSCDDCPCCQNDAEHNVWYCSAMDGAAVFKDIYRPNWCPLK